MEKNFESTHREVDPFWSLHETLTTVQAAALLCGYEPADVELRLRDTFFEQNYPRFPTAISLIDAAVDAGKIAEATRKGQYEVESIKNWLSKKGITTGFFFPSATVTGKPGYLDPSHKRFSPKLAAAVKVWEAMEDENMIGLHGTIVSMESWLNSRYKELDLEWQGAINKSGIEEIAKVANWKTKGGATKTPG